MTDSAIPAMEMPPPAPPPSAERLQEALPRRRFFSDMPDKGLFGGAAAAGFTIICMFKLFSTHTDLISVLAVMLMVTYGAVAYRMPQVQMRLDRLGDNFYYLGSLLSGN